MRYLYRYLPLLLLIVGSQSSFANVEANKCSCSDSFCNFKETKPDEQYSWDGKNSKHFKKYSKKKLHEQHKSLMSLSAPQSNDDSYMTGYVQSFVDTYYYDFKIRVMYVNEIVYVFRLPHKNIIKDNIIRCIKRIPFVKGVCAINTCPNGFLLKLEESNQELAKVIKNSSAFDVIFNKTCQNSCYYTGVWFPRNVLFEPFMADPRQVCCGGSIRFKDSAVGDTVGFATFGDQFIIYRFIDVAQHRIDIELGIEAGTFSVFNLSNIDACMVNTDFFVALISNISAGKWCFRTRLWHLSSHLGDEYILNNPTTQRYNLSDEGVDAFASYQVTKEARTYFGLGYIYARDASFPEKPFYIEFGTEIKFYRQTMQCHQMYAEPFIAAHFKLWQEHNYDVDKTFNVGIEWNRLENIGKKFRLFVEFHDGFSYEGQFIRKKSKYFALKTSFSY